jgi:hypothetical protein
MINGNLAEEEAAGRKALSALYSRGVRPIGLIRLETVCELEAKFCRNYYDCFAVCESGPLQKAIAQVSPYCASRMKKELHMTVKYPGRGVVPSMSTEDAEAFGQGSNFPTVRIFVRDIYVSSDRHLAAAVVFGVDTAVAAMGNAGDINGRTPAHLTLWASGGRAPVAAGHQLIGKQLETREPFVQVTEYCLREHVKKQRKTIDEKISHNCTIEKENRNLKRHVAVLEQLIVRRTVTAQAVVRGWLSRNLTYRTRTMEGITKAQRKLLLQMLGRWREWRYANSYDDYYDGGSDYGDWY